MTQDELEEVARDLMSIACDILTKLGPEVPFPHAIMALNRKKELTRMLLNNLPPEAWPLAVRKLERKDRFKWVAHVSDAWTRSYDDKDIHTMPMNTQVRDHPGREDALIVEVKAGQRLVVLTRVYHRDGAGVPVFREARQISTSHDTGMFSRVLGVGEPPDWRKTPPV